MAKIAITKIPENGISVKPVSFLKDEFRDYLGATKRAGLEFNSQTKSQTGRLSDIFSTVQELTKSGFDVVVDVDLKDAIEALQNSSIDQFAGIEERIGEFGERLFAYQKDGVRWLASRENALLADTVGLGKTAQALVSLPKNAPVLVVAPSSVALNWLKEAKFWRPDFVGGLIKGRKNFRYPRSGEILVVTYDSLPAPIKVGRTYLIHDSEGPAPVNLHVIFDELHKAKNSKSLRSKACRALVSASNISEGKAWGLTGTPFVNKPSELWTILSVLKLANTAYGSWNNFVDIYGGYEGDFGLEWTGHVDSKRAAQGLRKVSLRRSAEDHLDLPDILYQEIPVSIGKSTTRVCDSVVRDLGGAEKLSESLATLLESKNGVSFEKLSMARSALASEKIQALTDLVSDYEDQEEPVLVFSCHRAPLDSLSSRERWGSITGSESPEERQRTVDDFQKGYLKGVAISILAGAEGITLTRASHAIFVDRWWNPAINGQAEARIRRIGQKSSSLHVVDLVADHILDERLHEILVDKSSKISASVEASAVSASVDGDIVDTVFSNPLEGVEFSKISNGPEGREKLYTRSYRKPSSNIEKWAVDALTKLSANDQDLAREQNGVGFNRVDGKFGHSLADHYRQKGGLSEKQYTAAIKLCRKYTGQVGACPEQ